MDYQNRFREDEMAITEHRALGFHKCNSKVLAAIHETAQDFYEAGLIDEDTMVKIDKACLLDANPEEEIKPHSDRK